MIYGLITLFFSLYSSYFFLKGVIKEVNYTLNHSTYKNEPLLFNFRKRQLIKIILYFIVSISLLIQSYFFHFHDYFLRRGEIYIEFYKRLIIKNRKEEAELIRYQLPRNVEDFVINSGNEMQNVTA